MKKMVASLALGSLLLEILAASPKTTTKSLEDELSSLVESKTAFQNDRKEPVKEIIKGEGYSALVIGAQDVFYINSKFMPLKIDDERYDEYVTTNLAYPISETEKIKRWHSLTTPDLLPISKDYTLDQRINKFDWQKPKNIWYIADTTIKKSLNLTRNHQKSYDRILIIHHGQISSFDNFSNDNVHEDDMTRAKRLAEEYPPKSMEHLLTKTGYVTMMVCHATEGEHSLAQVFANAFSRPVIAAPKVIDFATNVISPYVIVNKSKEPWIIQNSYNDFITRFEGDFRVIDPN